MKFSKQWLDTFLKTPLSTDELVQRLNSAGLEVDGVNPAAVEFSGVRVAYVQQVEKHPDADKLSVVQVQLSEQGEATQVVCGAKNVRAGLKVAFATIGAKLGPDFKIKKTKLRGVESQGMICSESELGLAESSEGIWELPDNAPLGQDLCEYLGLPDDIIEIDLTPNRADCLSVQGVARDVAAMMRTVSRTQQIEAVPQTHEEQLAVKIENETACVRYCGRVIKNVDLSKATPLWMQERLRRSGIRTINPVVDVTNYVLLEIGQPMHGFDLKKIDSTLVIRDANSNESLQLLDESKVQTKAGTLLIADEHKPLALAGVMGGLESSVTNEAQDIFFESAAFAPEALAGVARQYGLHTDSSHRFERGVSPDLARDAIEYATALLLKITGGEPGPVTDVKSQYFPEALIQVKLRHASVARLLGIELEVEQIQAILTGLGFETEFDSSSATWSVIVPKFRFDIRLEADLIEEIARLYGYDNIALTRSQGQLIGKAVPETHLTEVEIYQCLKTLGYSEMISYSFIDPKVQQHFSEQAQVQRLVNPISEDLSEMRTSLVPGLLQAVKYNLARQIHSVKLFESGLVFKCHGEQLEQSPKIAGILTGMCGDEDWAQSTRKYDFYDLKGDLEQLLSLTGCSFSFEKISAAMTYMHPGQSAILLDQESQTELGYLGAIHPNVSKALGLKSTAFVFELDRSIFDHCGIPSYQAISKFPHTRRDLALVIDDTIDATKMLTCIRKISGDSYHDAFVFDLYKGSGVPEGKKSVAIGVNLKSIEKTFTDQEINAIMDKILHTLKSEYGAELRE